MATHTATQRTTHGLSPRLGTALSTLDTSLDAKRSWHRNDHRLESLSQEDVSSNKESKFESDPVEVEPTEATLVATPPPVPPNKKLLAAGFYDREISDSRKISDASKSGLLFQAKQKANHLKGGKISNLSDIFVAALLNLLTRAAETKAIGREIAHTIVPQAQTLSVRLAPIQHLREVATPHRNSAPNSYLASSKELTESLEGKTAQTNPTVLATGQASHKTVLLLVGAVLGFSGFLAGLGASYMVSNPPVTQRSANSWDSFDVKSTATKAFDPPGLDLSSTEFVKLKIDNLSSLQMPSDELITPDANNLEQLSPRPSNLEGLPAAPMPAEASGVLSTSDHSSDLATIESQAAMWPVGMTYYVTVPFTSERSLGQIRQLVSEAFVRQFADGNRIQIGAFDNPHSARQLLEKLRENNVEAEVYGPTTE